MQKISYGIAIAIFGASMVGANANDALDRALIAPQPTPAQNSNAAGFAVPTPNGGAIVGGQYGGTGGVFTHTPHGGGYTTNSATVGNSNGNVGGYATTGPNGLVGGGLSVGHTF